MTFSLGQTLKCLEGIQPAMPCGMQQPGRRTGALITEGQDPIQMSRLYSRALMDMHSQKEFWRWEGQQRRQGRRVPSYSRDQENVAFCKK